MEDQPIPPGTPVRVIGGKYDTRGGFIGAKYFRNMENIPPELYPGPSKRGFYPVTLSPQLIGASEGHLGKPKKVKIHKDHLQITPDPFPFQPN